MADNLFPKGDPDKPAEIDATFRNGSVTAIGVVLSFSLGFLNNWTSQPTVWKGSDLAAIATIALGLGCQFRALAGMLSIASLQLLVYNRLIRVFLIGLALVVGGVAIALTGDAIVFGEAAHKP
jgi:hypothetical protein